MKIYKKISLKRKLIFIFIFALISISLTSCGVYSFTGADIDYSKTKTFQVNYFQNVAQIVEPGISRTFTLDLQEILLNQTSLDLVNNNGDLLYEGEITEYYVAPITATSQTTAAQNRLTISVNVRFFNRNNEEKGFEQRFSFYKDLDGQSIPTGSTLDDILSEIFERITQDIFNKSLANW